jgi:hypothetical protein
MTLDFKKGAIFNLDRIPDGLLYKELLRRRKQFERFDNCMKFFPIYWVMTEEGIIENNLKDLMDGKIVGEDFLNFDLDTGGKVFHDIYYKKTQDGRIERKITITWEDVSNELSE